MTVPSMAPPLTSMAPKVDVPEEVILPVTSPVTAPVCKPVELPTRLPVILPVAEIVENAPVPTEATPMSVPSMSPPLISTSVIIVPARSCWTNSRQTAAPLVLPTHT